MNKKTLLWGALVVVAVIAVISIANSVLSKPQTQAKPLPNDTQPITPTEAASIALKEYPQGKVRAITLEEENDGYYYEVAIIDGQQEYGIAVDAKTGIVLANLAKSTNNETAFLTISAALARVENELPDAHITELALEEDEKFIFFKAEAIKDDVEHTLYLHNTTGTVIKRDEKPLKKSVAFDQYLSFKEMITNVKQLVPNGHLVDLELNYDEKPVTYEATLVDQQYAYEYTLDAVTGDLLEQDKEAIELDDYPQAFWNNSPSEPDNQIPSMAP